MDRQELIGEYLDNRLAPQDLEEFKLALQEDLALREEVGFYIDLRAVQKEQEKEDLKKRLQSLEQEKPQRNTTLAIVVAAIVFILAVVSAFLFLNEDINTQELYTSYYDTYPNNLRPTARGDVTKETLPFREYEIGNYNEAADGFLILLENGVQPDIQFYYAMSILNAGQGEEEALMQLNSLEERNTKYMPQVLWYSGLLELKRDSLDAATVQLTKLVAHPAKFKNREAQELLKKIN